VIARGWNAWVDWLATPESATAAALFRVATGLGVIVSIAPVLEAGVALDLWTDRAFGGIEDVTPGWLVSLLGGPTPLVVSGVLAAALLGGVFLIIGFGGRLTSFATLQLCIALFDLNTHAGGSHDELLTNALWLVFLMGGTGTLSLDARLRTGRWYPEAMIGRWARFLVVYQLVLMYATTGWQKLSSHWVPGGGETALYYILQQPTWQRVDFRWVAWEPWFTLSRVGTATSWTWEVFSPIWLVAWVASMSARPSWWRRLRVREVYAVVGVLFHILILVAMEVGPFSWVSLAYYTCVVHPWEWDAAFRGPGNTRSGGRSGQPIPCDHRLQAPGTSARASSSPHKR
jgi:hypothetical protein